MAGTTTLMLVVDVAEIAYACPLPPPPTPVNTTRVFVPVKLVPVITIVPVGAVVVGEIVLTVGVLGSVSPTLPPPPHPAAHRLNTNHAITMPFLDIPL